MPLHAELVVAADHVVGLQSDPAHLVGTIRPVRKTSSKREVRTVFEIPLRHQFTGPVTVDQPRRPVLLVKRVEQLVETTIAVAVAVHTLDDHVQHDPLQCLVVSRRRVRRDPGAILSDDLVGPFPAWIGLAQGQLPGLLRMTADVIHDCQDDLLAGIEILHSLLIA